MVVMARVSARGEVLLTPAGYAPIGTGYRGTDCDSPPQSPIA
jgi:hypothetical protein